MNGKAIMAFWLGEFMCRLRFLWMLLLAFDLNAVPFDYMVFEWDENQGLKLYSHQEVDLPLPLYEVVKPGRGDFVVIEDEAGHVLQAISLKHMSVQRSEHHGYQHIKDSSFEKDKLTFVVRTPAKKARVLKLGIKDKNIHTTFDLRTLVNHQKIIKVESNDALLGTSDNEINLLFMGDGYLSSQNGIFNQQVDQVSAYMNTFEPYQSYQSFISVDRLFMASNQEGADHPTSPCGGVTDPQAPLLVDTRYDATYCTFSIHRLLTVNSSKVYTDAANLANWDEIVMLVNDDTYGGSGGSFSTISAHPSAADVFIHELGHSFTDLADEYDSAYPGFPLCSDVNGPTCEANVTDVTTRNNLKWNYFVNQSTPIPTPDTQQYSSVMGLFEGARYQVNGMYRPVSACNMRFLGSPFCSVCQQAFVHKVYDVPYAQGNAKLSLIQPGTDIPGNNLAFMTFGNSQHLSLSLLQPSHELMVTWSVDGVPVQSGTSGDVVQVFNFTPTQNQINSDVMVKIEVWDPSPMVHNSLHADMPVFEHQWQVSINPSNDLIFEDGFEN